MFQWNNLSGVPMRKHDIKDRYVMDFGSDEFELLYFDSQPYPGWWAEASETMIGELHVRTVVQGKRVKLFTPISDLIEWLYKDMSQKRSEGYPRVALLEMERKIEALRQARRKLNREVPA